MTLNLPKRGFNFLVNFSQYLDDHAAHISTLNCDEMAGDRPGHFAHDIFFSIERTFLRIYK